MKILLDGYIDSNLGDDLMLMLAARELKEHELYTVSDKLNIENVKFTDKKSGFDCYLKVIGSGFFLHNNRGIPYRIREIRAEKRYAKNRAVIGCSIDVPLNKITEMLINRQLSHYGLVTVRDNFSYSFARKNAPKTRCERYPDMVFSLPDDMIPDVKSEGLLGISVHNSVSPNELAKTADSYIEKTGKDVMLLCFNTGRENDEAAAQAVFDMSENKSKISIVRYTTVSDMLSNMKRCGCILGVRLHSVVLAARMGIPFVPVAYSAKTSGVLSEIGYSEKTLDIDFKSGEAMERILAAKPYIISDDKVQSARQHALRFREYLER